jgi:hypothetical protein
MFIEFLIPFVNFKCTAFYQITYKEEFIVFIIFPHEPKRCLAIFHEITWMEWHRKEHLTTGPKEGLEIWLGA